MNEPLIDRVPTTPIGSTRMNVLVINASPRRERSLSRRLASEFLARWRALRMPAALKPGSTR